MDSNESVLFGNNQGRKDVRIPGVYQVYQWPYNSGLMSSKILFEKENPYHFIVANWRQSNTKIYSSTQHAIRVNRLLEMIDTFLGTATELFQSRMAVFCKQRSAQGIEKHRSVRSLW